MGYGREKEKAGIRCPDGQKKEVGQVSLTPLGKEKIRKSGIRSPDGHICRSGGKRKLSPPNHRH